MQMKMNNDVCPNTHKTDTITHSKVDEEKNIKNKNERRKQKIGKDKEKKHLIIVFVFAGKLPELYFHLFCSLTEFSECNCNVFNCLFVQHCLTTLFPFFIIRFHFLRFIVAFLPLLNVEWKLMSLFVRHFSTLAHCSFKFFSFYNCSFTELFRTHYRRVGCVCVFIHSDWAVK